LSDVHKRIAIDSNVLIYLLESPGPLAEAAAEIVDGIENGSMSGVMSSIATVEILTGPARAGDGPGFESAAEMLRDLPVRVVPLDEAIAEDAAWVRGTTSVGLEDAVHLASARSAGATAFVTNDRLVRSIPRLEVVYLDEIGLGGARPAARNGRP
jgi:predicted nucleic acid-binding protein